MNRPIQRAARLLTCGCATAITLIGSARADDSEIYISQSSATPNIMLILDTSGSMGGKVKTQEPYNPDRNYIGEASGACTGMTGRVFFKLSDQGIPNSCDSASYVNAADMRCAAANSALDTTGAYPGDRFVQWRDSGDGTRRWLDLQAGAQTSLDCRNDGAPYPNGSGSGNTDTPDYTDTLNDSFWQTNSAGGASATLYSANYVAYYNQFRVPVDSTRLAVMQAAAKNLLNSVSNVNVGLMRYSLNNPNNGGGMVLAPVAPIAQNRADLINFVDNFVASGNTPLSETLYESHQYFTGRQVVFGDTSRGCYKNRRGNTVCDAIPSAAAAISGGNYISPITQSCQKNYIVYLTDGEPTLDNETDGTIKALPGFTTEVPLGCNGDSNGDGTVDTHGSCLGALAEYMYDRDLSNQLTDKQNVTSYFIGFGSDFGGTSNAAFDYLLDAGQRGGGNAYQAGDLSDLTKVFTDIFNTIAKDSSTMTAPTVAVNAFNRTRTLDSLYLSLFKPSGTRHWPGNVKKFRVAGNDEARFLAKGDVVAVDANGAFLNSISDYWSDTANDGSQVELGGAAREIPNPAARKVYTFLGTNASPAADKILSSNANAVSVDNTALTDAELGTNTNNPVREKLIRWARGADVDDTDDDRNTDEPRFEMGDPMHSQPAVVIYGGAPASKNADDAVVFTATNDGYLHAFATTTGEELWSYIPKEMLPGLKGLYNSDYSAGKSYAIDGDLRILKYDTNGDGIVNPDDADRVLLFFSTGRNRTVSRYYALDVTYKNSPKFLWSIGPDELPGLGQAWSRPTITRVNISGARQNTQKLVLVFGGGYDPLEESGPFLASTAVGNRIFMVDALYGSLLWSAGDDAIDSRSTLKLARMKHSIPAPVSVMDLDGDSFAERMYVGDMGGQVWRFDIYNGMPADATLVTGGVIASLGAKDETPSAANTRRFYNAPDTSIIKVNNRRIINIAIGSGYRGHPLRTTNQDRFYAIRDRQPFAKLTQAQYDNFDITNDNELDDITTNLAPTLPANSRGWKLQLNYPAYAGEKVLNSSTTFGNAVFFTTYLPGSSNNTCSVAVGSNRAYAISVIDGSPLPKRETSTTPPTNPPPPPPTPTRTDRYTGLGQTGIAPEVTLLFPDKDKVTCLAGVEVLTVCKDFDSRIKTYWRQTNAN